MKAFLELSAIIPGKRVALWDGGFVEIRRFYASLLDLNRPSLRSRAGHFFQSCWTKELSVGKCRLSNSGQFGSGVVPRQKHNHLNPKPKEILDFRPCFPRFGNDEVVVR